MSGAGDARGDWTRPAEITPTDAERQEVANRLRDAVAAGILPFDELEQRINAAYAAETFEDLDNLVRWLPAQATSVPAGQRRAGQLINLWLVGFGLGVIVLILAVVGIATRRS
ncbi:MAG TPA: DUF1707 domain-containing protein, partial [Acidimicrobiales bacterium]|nr:DUF1707 domain-containing protein [Acidimicrobiales bacterium]